MGADPTRESATCGHPKVGSPDNTELATPTDMYASRHDPFVYFDSIIDHGALCDSHVVNLDALPKDLSHVSTTRNYTYITPDLCDDGHDSPCADGEPGGLPEADKFLKQWVPKITSSKAFRDDGLLIVTFDEGATSDASSCCGEIPGPATPLPGGTGPGGGRVGAVLLSPCITAGTVVRTPYNHYTMLGSIENMFGLKHLGYAWLPRERYFGADIFKRRCGPSPTQITVGGSAKAKRTKITVKWSTSDAGGPGVAHYTVQVRQGEGRMDDRAWPRLDDQWSTVSRARPTRASRRVEFLDKLGKTSLIPSRRLLRARRARGGRGSVSAVPSPRLAPGSSSRRAPSSSCPVDGSLCGVDGSGERVDHRAHQVDRHREHDRRVLVGADLAQRLQVAQLQRHRVVADHVGGVGELGRRLELALGVDDLRAALALGLGLAGDRVLHPLGDLDVLDLDRRDLDPPRLGLRVDHVLERLVEMLALGQQRVEVGATQHRPQRRLRDLQRRGLRSSRPRSPPCWGRSRGSRRPR